MINPLLHVELADQRRSCSYAPAKSGSGTFRWNIPENAVVFVVKTASKVGLLLSSFQHQVRRVLGGLVLRHRESKSA